MKIYAAKEIDYKKVKLKKAKMLNRQGKGKRPHSGDRPSLFENSNTSIILDKLDELHEDIERNSRCCKRLKDLDRALLATFKCTICLNVMSAESIKFQICCNRLVACGKCAEEWYATNSTCPHCRDEEGRVKRKKGRGFERLVSLIEN